MSDANRKIRLVKSMSHEEEPARELPDALDVEFVYPGHSVVVADEGPDTYIHSIHGRIEFSTAYEDKESGEYGAWRTEAGRFHALYVDAALAREEGTNLSEVMDAESAEMAEICATLYDPATDGFRSEAGEPLQGDAGSNILAVHRVEILPTHRGMGLGLAALWYLIRLHSAGCGLVILKAVPAQYGARFGGGQDEWAKRMAYDTFPAGQEEARRKLVSLCEKLGFRHIGGNGVMALSMTAQNPVPEEIFHWVPRQVIPAGVRNGGPPGGVSTPHLVGSNLKRLREVRDWSRPELARILGVNEAYINNVESGRKGVGLDRIERWARVFDVPIGEFFLPRR